MALADYAMSSGLEDLNDEEKMNKLLAALAADEATAYPIPSDDSMVERKDLPAFPLSPSETMFNRVINRVSPTDPDGPNPARPRPRMLTNPSKAKDLWGNLTEFGMGLAEEKLSQADLMDKYGSGFEDPTKPTEEEPELFRTLWNLIQKSLQDDAKSLTGMFGEGKDKKDTDTPFFKPLSASQLVEHEKFVNQAPLVERWAAQMKEQIGWQYMTPDERRDYIKNNKHDKNNHIIMDYNMYRRR